ncbi:MAG: hypothetical protein K0S55_183 [Clostridia bacterium]|nr:hypothetical protein [Clostridia bacterium]
MIVKLSSIVQKFGFNSEISDLKKLEIGHINDTYTVDLKGKKYIIQRINGYVFKNPAYIMENIERVTTHIQKKAMVLGKDPQRATLCFLHAEDGHNYFIDNDGSYWRICPYIENTTTFQTVENKDMLYGSGYAFGFFQNMLDDFPMNTLHETITDFHNTKKRLDCFFDIVKKDPCGRAAEVKKDIEFFIDRRERSSKLINLIENKKMPIRVTHNDTKFDNILIDKETFEAVCVIDLDTVMPGLAVHDFGDAIRIIGNNAAEDEIELDKVTFNIEYFEIFTKGFLAGVNGLLKPIEFENMALGCINITTELASRFLADHLNGDKYFKIHRPDHNLQRARNQMKLVIEMEKNFTKMNEVIDKYR